MQTWTRARRSVLCGRCGMYLPPETPVLELRIGLIVKWRCPDCAPSPPPPDLPETLDVKTPTPVLRFSRLLPLDWRTRRSGEE